MGCYPNVMETVKGKRAGNKRATLHSNYYNLGPGCLALTSKIVETWKRGTEKSYSLYYYRSKNLHDGEEFNYELRLHDHLPFTGQMTKSTDIEKSMLMMTTMKVRRPMIVIVVSRQTADVFALTSLLNEQNTRKSKIDTGEFINQK